jgi:hypothetical protein
MNLVNIQIQLFGYLFIKFSKELIVVFNVYILVEKS